MKEFDPNKVSVPNGNLWALPFSVDEAELVIIPRPIDITTSFRDGTSDGPAAILAASPQIDLYDEDYPDMWKKGIAIANNPVIVAVNPDFRADAKSLIACLEGRQSASATKMESVLVDINGWMSAMTHELRQTSRRYLDHGKLIAVLGGDHSTPLGLMQALANRHADFGVLHLDAHFDLRDAYMGFEQSHASIMRNASKIPQISRFVHVGIRDFCVEERGFWLRGSEHKLFSARELARAKQHGVPWQKYAESAVEQLPKCVYVSFDVDVLDPSLCPNTGTPVPGGLQYEEALSFVHEIVYTGRRIIGFDLVEVAPASNDPDTWATDWNANVGMRLLYRLSILALASQKNT